MSPAIEKMLAGNRDGVKRAGPEGNLRMTTQLRWRAFVYEYLIDFDIVRAYRATIANPDTDDFNCIKCAGKLLRSTFVQQIIDEEECRVIGEKQHTKDMAIKQIQRLYIKAMSDRDYSSAKGALDMLCKHYGLYKEHNKQRKYGVEEVAAIRRKLEENGVSFDAPNKPKAIENSVIEDIQEAEVIEKEVTG